MDYKIVSDGCCDLKKEIIEKYDLDVIPFYISFDHKTYVKEIEEIGIREVYDRMVSQPDVYPMTSLPSMQDYIDVFERYNSLGMAVICLCFTPSLSGSYNCACNARDVFCEEHPEARISVINSEAGTVTQALLVVEAARMRADGISYEKNVRILEKMKKTNRIFFTVGDTDYLQHGGRIGKLAGVAASALKLKPMITLRYGVIESSGIGRSRKKTIQKTIELMDDYFRDTGDAMEDYRFLVGFGYDIEEGQKYYQKISSHIFGESKVSEVGILQIGATIAVHTGPYAIGIGILKKYESFLDESGE